MAETCRCFVNEAQGVQGGGEGKVGGGGGGGGKELQIRTSIVCGRRMSIKHISDFHGADVNESLNSPLLVRPHETNGNDFLETVNLNELCAFSQLDAICDGDLC